MREKALEFTREVRDEVTASGKCGVCGEQERLAVHHIIPVSFGKRLRRMKDELTSECYEGYRNWIRSSRNGIGVCKFCHVILDEQAQRGVYFGIDRIGFQFKERNR